MRTELLRRFAAVSALTAACAVVGVFAAAAFAAPGVSGARCGVGGDANPVSVLTFTASGFGTDTLGVRTASGDVSPAGGFVVVDGSNTISLGARLKDGVSLDLYATSNPAATLATAVCGAQTSEQQLNTCLTGPTSQIGSCIRAIPGVQACLNMRGLAVLQCLGTVFPQARDCLSRPTLPQVASCMQGLFPGLLPRP